MKRELFALCYMMLLEFLHLVLFMCFFQLFFVIVLCFNKPLASNQQKIAITVVECTYSFFSFY